MAPNHPDRGDVRLRLLQPDDVDDIVAAVSEPGLVRFTRVPAPYSADQAREFVAGCRPRKGEPARTLALAVPDADRAAGRLVGVVGLDVDERDGNAELGYWTAPAGRGRGLTTWGARETCRRGFDVLGLARIHLTTSVDNPASSAIAARLGFVHTGTARSAILHRGLDGTPMGRSDAAEWDLLRGELR